MNLINNKLFTLSGVVFGSLLLTACPNENNDAPVGSEPDAEVPAQALYSPFTGVVPLPNNLFFQAQPGQPQDGTLNIPSTSAPALAANQLDGWSTVAPAVINMSEAVDPATVGSAVTVFHVCINPASKAPISPGEIRYTPDTLISGTDYIAEVSSVDNTQILVKPINPLRGKFDPLGPCAAVNLGASPAENGYIITVNSAIKTAAGDDIAASSVYTLLKNTQCYYRFVDNDPDCPNAGVAGTTQAGIDAGLDVASDASQRSTETLRRLTIGQEGLAAFFSGGAVNSGNIILSFSFSTQSIGNSLAAVKAALNPMVAKSTEHKEVSMMGTPVQLGFTGFNTEQLGATGAGEVYAGTITLPYYLPVAAHNKDTAVITGNWVNSDGKSPNFLNPAPVKQADVTVPVFAVMPTSAAPSASVPVAIVQHGITSNRTQVLAIADALASVGIATVAIDLPLHGINDSTSPLRVAYDYDTREGERTFDVDFVVNGAASVDACDPFADAAVEDERDGSGTHFINLPSLLTSRDNLRQAVADLLSVESQLGNFTWIKPVEGAAPEIRSVDPDQLTFVGHSLGGIVGGTYLALSDKVKAASLLTTGGGIAKLLDASAGFGPVVSAGLEAQGVQEGTNDYEQFLLFAQTAADSGDPINYASLLAAKNTPIHNVVITGGARGVTALIFNPDDEDADPVKAPVRTISPPDLVVPNDAFNAVAAFGENIPVSGLGGSVPLYQQLGLTTVTRNRDCSVRAASAKVAVSSIRQAVLFDSGSHGTPLRPKNEYPNPADPTQRVCVDETNENAELLRQVAAFAASQGTSLPVSSACDT